MNNENIIEIKDLKKTYENGVIKALDGINLEIKKGESISIIGPSGSGKSTLLNMIGALDKADEGHITVAGMDLMQKEDLSKFRLNEIGFVFQLHNLIPDLTLEENCLIPTVAAGTDHRTAMVRLKQLADRTGLSHRLGHRIQKLSGGERQRTALCRALMNRPKILLADEPTGSLDEQTSVIVFELLMDLVATEGVTLVMATHDRGLAERCDRLLEMHDGRIHELQFAR